MTPSTEHLRAHMVRCGSCGLLKAEGAWCARCLAVDPEYRAAAEHHAAVPDIRPAPVDIDPDGLW